MCEFNVILNGKTVCKDVVYAQVERGKVVVRDVLGVRKEFESCEITEIDVNSTRLVLSKTKS